VLFNEIKKPEKKKTNPKVRGKKTFQPIAINWSKRNLGKFARTKINKKVMRITLNEKNTVSNNAVNSEPCVSNEILLPPPKKKIINKQLINKILAYSPKKNAANRNAEYSTLYPATNSASASGKSNGARFVSAKIDIIKIIPKGRSGKINQPLSFCTSIIVFKFKEPANKIIGSIIKLMETSYEIICDTDLKQPIKAYLELLAQPDNKIP